MKLIGLLIHLDLTQMLIMYKFTCRFHKLLTEATGYIKKENSIKDTKWVLMSM